MKYLTGALLSALIAVLLVSWAPTASAAACSTGPYQSYAEAFLGLPVDGRNSDSDCSKIKAWQASNDIVPAAGYAGSTTYDVMKRKKQAKSRASYCPKSYSRVVCVDLTSQMMWISEYGKRVWGPYHARSGRDGYETRTTTNRGGYCPDKYSRGTLDCQVFRRVLNDYSARWESPMPYAMYFDGGEAFHKSDRYIYNTLGSHGCIHVLPSKAPWLWSHMPNGTKVFVFGRKPGT